MIQIGEGIREHGRRLRAWEIAGLFGSSLLVGYSGAMMPGPVTILVISQSARQGLIASPLLSLGHIGIELATVVALLAGLSKLLRRSRAAGIIGLVGGLVLLWMGLDILRSVLSGGLSLSLTAGPVGGMGSLRLVGSGVVASLANPYWVLWWATVGLSYVMLSLRKGVAGLLAFYLGHSLADFSWNGFLGILVVSGRKLLSDAVYGGILLASGLALIGLSAYFIYSGWNFLRGQAAVATG